MPMGRATKSAIRKPVEFDALGIIASSKGNRWFSGFDPAQILRNASPPPRRFYRTARKSFLAGIKSKHTHNNCVNHFEFVLSRLDIQLSALGGHCLF